MKLIDGPELCKLAPIVCMAVSPSLVKWVFARMSCPALHGSQSGFIWPHFQLMYQLGKY